MNPNNNNHDAKFRYGHFQSFYSLILYVQVHIYLIFDLVFEDPRHT